MKFYLLIQMIGLLLLPLQGIAQMIDLKLPAIGYLSLVLDSETSGLNPYDFSTNPAWLILDQSQSWFAFSSRASLESGEFKRRYDPDEAVDFVAVLEGVKILGPHQAFWGAANYHALRLIRVNQAINRHPYADCPFRLTDETMGNFDYWGPSVAAQYSRQLLGDKLYWGASLDYRIETGLKDVFPQPRIIDREIGTSMGIAWRMFNPLTAGALLQYTDSQEFVEAQTSSQFEQRTIVITLFRGENIGVNRFGAFEQFTNHRKFRSLLQLHYRPGPLMESTMLLGYRMQRLQAFESSVKPVPSANWSLRGFELHWKIRVTMLDLPLRFGWSVDYDYCNDWAVHPAFDLLWGDDYWRTYQIGIGMAYFSPSAPLFLGIEYHINQVHQDKNDYISQLFSDGKMNCREFRCGAELSIMKNWKIRTGYNYQLTSVANTLLSFGEFLPDYHRNRMTFGLACHFEQIEFELTATYDQRLPHHTANQEIRNSLSTMIGIKYFRNQ